MSIEKVDGDSRSANAGSHSIGTTTFTNYGVTGATHMGLLQQLFDNAFMLAQGYNHAIGGSTTYAMLKRSETLATATTGNQAATEISAVGGNYLGAQVADGQFSSGSDGLASVRTQSGNYVFSASVSVNDGSGNQAAYYNQPVLAKTTMLKVAAYADALIAAGKTWVLGNEMARGGSAYLMDPKTPSANAWAATSGVKFQDGESYGAPGVIAWDGGTTMPYVMTKVASNPGQGQYTVDASGNYLAGGTAPAKVWLNNNAGADNASPFGLTMRDWFNSSAANFTSTQSGALIDYAIPGFQYGRPQHLVVDSFGATLDASSGTSYRSKPGMLDNLSLHAANALGSFRWAKAAKAAFIARFGAIPNSNDQRPTRNNWQFARGTGVGTTFTGVLPPTMRLGFTGTPAKTLLSINGAVIGKVDTATGVITGPNITGGSYNFTTGAITVSLNSASLMPANAQLWAEQDIGNYDYANMVEGTIGRNTIMNALMDPAGTALSSETVSGSNITAFVGTSNINGVNANQVPWGIVLGGTTAGFTAVNDMLTAGTLQFAVLSGIDPDGFPYFGFEALGIHTAAATFRVSTPSLNGVQLRLNGGSIYAGLRTVYMKHSVLGRFFGTVGRAFSGSTAASPGVTRTTNNGAQVTATQLLTRGADGTSGMFIDDTLLNEAGGTGFATYAVSPLLDVSDVTGFGTSSANADIPTAANTPFAFRVLFGRMQFRRRSDLPKF
ncbi:hypothetical protein [Sphingomonas sp.]|uniref:hypothetical protein n=1 Tax=Sphingomonas sp. TaxID=28214 RepID=UPI0028A9E1D5|nr:hypothetical protein [Sphingomonas sp.]